MPSFAFAFEENASSIILEFTAFEEGESLDLEFHEQFSFEVRTLYICNICNRYESDF